MATLKETVQARIMDDMIKAVTGGGKDESQWKVLVVDHEAMRIMNSSVRMFDVTDAGVTIVENLAQKRQPLRSFEAIYFVGPTEDSIEKIVKDFEPGRVRYKAAHIFTTRPCPDNLFRKLTSSDIAKYVKRFTELNLDFLTIESNVFSLDRPLEFYNLYSPNAQEKDTIIAGVAEQLATVCVTLGDNPYVCFLSASDRTHKLATALQARLDQFVQGGELSATQTNRAQLLIVDRAADVITPLLHELTYQAMAYDLMPLPDDVFKFKGGSGERMAILGEQDNLWTTMRHMHIGDAMPYLADSFKEFRDQKSKAITQGNNMKDLQAIIKAAPQLTEQTNKFELHLELSNQLNRIRRETGLDDLCVAEQNMVMGEDGEGQKKNPLLNIIQLLQSSQVPVNNKIRLLALYVLIKEKGISTSDMEKLFSQAQITPQTPNSKAIANMDLLDVTVNTDNPRPRKPIKRKDRVLTDVYVTSRWTPLLRDLLEDVADGKPDKNVITYVRDTPPKQGTASASSAPVSARSKPGWAKKGGNVKEEKGDKFAGPRIIVYVAGGMTMSEMRIAAEVMKAANRQVVIGSSVRMLPEMFLTNLDNLRNAPQVAYPALQPQHAL
eukprot:comp23690_c0_seq1/m.40673 comp23690_c0_seq1/g.40673  ORF comp23690_c0_seq1/g.40673 comp23690_c0_seq1/m.40673 type:complete len:608 (-) comp23690_c0_seq1:409-2232(-)